MSDKVAELKCPWTDCAVPQRLRNALVSVKVECRRAEERRDYYLKAGQSELAQNANATLRHYLKEISLSEKEIALLKSSLSGKKGKISL